MHTILKLYTVYVIMFVYIQMFLTVYNTNCKKYTYNNNLLQLSILSNKYIRSYEI